MSLNIRNRSAIASAAVVSILSLAVAVVYGQAPAYRAPRAADGNPNFNGIWQALNEAYWDIEAHAAAPAPVPALGAAGAIPPGHRHRRGRPAAVPAAAAADRRKRTSKIG